MGKLPRLTGKEIIKILTKQEYTVIRIEGSHHVLKRPDGRITVIPVHASEEIGPGLLTRIIKKELGISRETFEKWVQEFL